MTSLFNTMFNHPRQAINSIWEIKTTSRRLAKVSRHPVNEQKTNQNMVHYGRIELDSHADTIVCGKNCIVLEFTGRECDVSPYTDAYDSIKNVPIVQAATAWTSEETGETIILVFNEALWMGNQMEHSLINPNQLRHFGIHVQDNPYALAPLFIMAEDTSFSLPLAADGTTIFADTRTPTQQELEESRHIQLSSKHPWNPLSIQFPTASRTVEEEIQMQRTIGAATVGEVEFNSVDSTTVCYDIGQLNTRLISSVRVPNVPQVRMSSVQDVPSERTFQSRERHSAATPEDLSEKWHITLEQAKQTLKRTTQWLVRSALLPLSRQYKADRMFMKKRLAGDWYTDTLDGRVRSRDGNQYAQVFANKSFFAAIYPMDSKSKAGDALRVFCEEFGVPDRLVSDGSKEQTGHKTEFIKTVRKNNITHHVIEPERHNQNPAEGVIRELRRKWFRVMIRKRVPKMLWDYGMRWVAETMQLTYNTSRGLSGGGIPLEQVTGDTPDISEYLDFGFYDRVYYFENAGLGPRMVGRWLGVSHRTGGLMAYWILVQNGSIISRTTVQRVTNLEMQVQDNFRAFEEFDASIISHFKEGTFDINGSKPRPEDWSEILEFDPDFKEEFDKVFSSEDVPEADVEFTPEVGDDTYLNMEVAIPRNGPGPEFAKVTKRLRDANGLPIGVANDNPILDSRMYEVEYSDDYRASMSANAIAQNLFASIDEEGNRHVLFSEIVDHRTDGTEVTQQDAFVTTRSGTKRRRETTKGWEILVQWKDGSTSWIALKDMKSEYPVQLAEYAVSARILLEPAFAWWVPHVLKKRNRIISKTK